MNNKKKKIGIALILALLASNLALASIFLIHGKGISSSKNVSKSDCRSASTHLTDDDARACWDGIMSRDGSEAGTKEFIKWNQGFSVDTQHSYAHVFGGLLYKHEGKEGLRFCTSDFAFGCYHEFLGKAIRAEGLGVAKELNDDCFKYIKFSPLSCQHGIGHGVLASVGYEDPDIRKSLTVCKDLPYADSVGGCYGGVFMEYNMRTMLGAHASIREMKSADGKGDGHDVCPSLELVYRNACYYWSPQWWAVSIGTRLVSGGDMLAVQEKKDTRLAIAKKLGEWCREAKPEHQEECYRGIGNIAGQESGYVSSETIAFCETAAAGNMALLGYCLQDAANSSATLPQYRETAKEICNPLSGDSLKICLDRVKQVPQIMN